MKKQIRAFVVLFLLTLFNIAFAATSPIPMLEKAADQLISQLQQNKSQLKTNPQLIYGFVKTIVIPHVAQEQMARSVVNPSTWNSASKAQQQQFVSAFRDLVIRTYASAFANYTSETVKFRPLRAAQLQQNYITVNSVVLRPAGAPPIPVSYSMSFQNNQWLVIDFSVDGVSMVNSFKSQFASLQNGQGLSGLIAVLQKHNGTTAK